MSNFIAWIKLHQAKIYMAIVGLAGVAYSLGWINATDAGVIAAVFGSGTGLSVHQMFVNGLNALNAPSSVSTVGYAQAQTMTAQASTTTISTP